MNRHRITAVKHMMTCIIAVVLIAVCNLNIYATEGFSDVPTGHWAADDINSLRALEVVKGEQFGLGKTISRGEFASFLTVLTGWDLSKADGLSDNLSAPVTREEMAVMIMTALGYDQLAQQLTYLDIPFIDVVSNKGHIAMATDFGIISGMGNGLFKPDSTATREQAAVMIMRMYRAMNSEVSFKNGFYAISSASQMDYIESQDSVSFGWCRLEIVDDKVTLNTFASNNNEYNIPAGYSEPLTRAKSGGKALLMVTSTDNVGLSSFVLSETARNGVIDQILQIVEGDAGPVFDGVVIDFENLRGQQAKTDFNGFLKSIKTRLNGKSLYVAVQPQRRTGLAYYDGYDFKAIGEVADKVILMAHDYNAKKLNSDEMASGFTVTPLAPIDEIYYGIRAITDEKTGVGDKSKILLQLSFDTAQWKTRDGAIIHDKPYNPDYEAVKNRIANSDTELNYSQKYESPYITFYNSGDNTDNIVWYEDTRSIEAKVNLAKMFGVTGISVWRMGIIPNYSVEGKEAYLKVYDFLKNLS